MPFWTEVVLVALAFGVGDVFGAVVAVLALVIARRDGPAWVAAVAMALLALAGAATLFVDAPGGIGTLYATDRGLAAAAGLGAGVFVMVAVGAWGVAEREQRRARPAAVPSRRDVRAAVYALRPVLTVAALALAVRVTRGPAPLRPDFAELVTNLRLGRGYARGTFGSLTATGLHPPLAPVLAAVWPGPDRVALVLVSALTAVAALRLGQRVGGRRTGLVAGILAAVLPSLWGQQLPEALAALAVTTALVLAWPAQLTAPRAAGAGLALGAAGLARPEAVLVLPVVLVWVWVVRGRPRTRELAIVAAVALAALAPWELRMQRTFDTWLPSTSLGATLEGANQAPARAGARSGELVPQPPGPSGENEGLVDRARRDTGWDAFRREARPPLLAARVLRGWDVWSPASVRDARAARGLDLPGGLPGVVLEGAASVVALGWLLRWRREWRGLLPFFVLPVAFTVLTALTYGSRDLRSWVAPLVAVALGSVVADLVVRRRASGESAGESAAGANS